MMRPVLRVAGVAIGGLASVIAVAALLGATLAGLFFLVLWLMQEPPGEYARKHVQALFVDESLKRTGTVESCRRIGNGEAPGEGIWACQVRGNGCLHTFMFAVSPEYGTAPYNRAAANATNDPCQR